MCCEKQLLKESLGTHKTDVKDTWITRRSLFCKNKDKSCASNVFKINTCSYSKANEFVKYLITNIGIEMFHQVTQHIGEHLPERG